MEKVGAFTERATTEGEWRAGNPSTGEQATPMLADYFNMLQRELLAILTAGGVVPDINTENQVLAAIQRLAGRGVTTVTNADSPKALTVAEAGLVLVDASAGDVTLTLPVAASNGGLRYTLLRMDGSANAVTVNPHDAAPDTIEGGSTLAIGSGQRRVLASIGMDDWVDPASLSVRDMPLRGIRVYDSPGVHTWDVPEGVTKAWVTVTGGGGSGAAGSTAYGSGGGAGGTSLGLVDLSGVSQVSVTVGAGGAGVNTVSAGNAGGQSSFGAFITAYGGAGGKYLTGADTGADPGVGGQVNLPGADGTNATSSSSGVYGGTGGSSYWGCGASGASNAGSSADYGGGSGGNVGGSSRAGGDGIVVIQW